MLNFVLATAEHEVERQRSSADVALRKVEFDAEKKHQQLELQAAAYIDAQAKQIDRICSEARAQESAMLSLGSTKNDMECHYERLFEQTRTTAAKMQADHSDEVVKIKAELRDEVKKWKLQRHKEESQVVAQEEQACKAHSDHLRAELAQHEATMKRISDNHSETDLQREHLVMEANAKAKTTRATRAR